MEKYVKNNYFHPHLPLRDYKGKNKIVLQELKELIKSLPYQDYPIEKLSKFIYLAESKNKELKKIKNDKKYPILVMVDEKEKVKYILDGNHRAQNAVNNKLKTISAKIIKPSYLKPETKKIVLSYFDKRSNDIIQKYLQKPTK